MNKIKTRAAKSPTKKSIIECCNLGKSFYLAEETIEVLSGISLTISHGEKVAIMGPSGVGKTTLLNILGGLDNPSEGTVLWEDKDIGKLGSEKLSRLRNGKIGFVYQFHHLLQEFSALENTALPLVIGGERPEKAIKKAEKTLKDVGLGERLNHKPGELSGGERQRVAVARALVVNPMALLMDEPTGNLDSDTAREIHRLFVSLANRLGFAIVLVTHDTGLAKMMDRKYVLRQGKIGSTRRRKTDRSISKQGSVPRRRKTDKSISKQGSVPRQRKTDKSISKQGSVPRQRKTDKSISKQGSVPRQRKTDKSLPKQRSAASKKPS